LDNSEIIAKVCSELTKGDPRQSAEILRENYPFLPQIYATRRYSEVQKTRIFLRDGFVDRYSGRKLVFPGTLKILSTELPEEFPYHPNWKQDSCHIGWWELCPTIDHIVPIARGGENSDSNFVTTSMLSNSIKSNFTLDELGWSLHPMGKLDEWDGLIQWFLDYVSEHQSLLDDAYTKKWHKAAVGRDNHLPSPL
jgi:hypothetical protein